MLYCAIASNLKLKILRKNQNGFWRKQSISQILTIRRSSCKKSQGKTIVCGFLQGIWFHTHRKNGANTSSLWSPQRNCQSHNDALQKHKSQGTLTRWRHELLWHCCWNSAKCSVYTLLRLCILNVDRSNKRKWLYTKKKR